MTPTVTTLVRPTPPTGGLQALDQVRRAYLQTRVDALADEWIGRSDDGPEHTAFVTDLQAMDSAVAALQGAGLAGGQRTDVDQLTAS